VNDELSLPTLGLALFGHARVAVFSKRREMLPPNVTAAATT
jgi:hypothetical protein